MAVSHKNNTRLFRKQRLRVLDRDGWVCVYCGAPAEHADHVIPKVRGGDDSLENLVAACKSCNLRKGKKSEAVFLGQTATPSVFSFNLHTETTSPSLSGPFEGQSRPLWS